MNRLAKYMMGAGTAAALTLTAAAPAQAQYYPNYPSRDYRDGIGIGDIIQGVAIAAAAATAIGAIRNATRGYDSRYGYPGRTYGYPAGNAYGYGVDYAVDMCAREAQRYGGRVNVTEVDRSGSRAYRVRGVIDANYNNDGYYNRGYDRYDRYQERRSFTCKASDNGRITSFKTGRA